MDSIDRPLRSANQCMSPKSAQPMEPLPSLKRTHRALSHYVTAQTDEEDEPLEYASCKVKRSKKSSVMPSTKNEDDIQSDC